MSSLSVTTLFSSDSGSLSRERPLAIDAMPSDAESTEGSSQAINPSSRDNPEPAMSSSLSAYHGEETREVEYVWVDNRVREFFSKYTNVSMLHDFVESFDIVLEGVLNGAFALRRCREFETVCLGRGKEAKDFFYFYSCLIFGNSCPLFF